MTNDQRRDMAYAILLNVWRGQNAVTEPTIDQAGSFANAIGASCPAAPSNDIATVAFVVYKLDARFGPP